MCTHLCDAEEKLKRMERDGDGGEMERFLEI